MVSDSVFARIVNEDVREQASDENASMLRQSEHLDRWKDALLDIKFNVEKQLANHKAEVAKARVEISSREEWLRFTAEKERWRASTIRLLQGVNRRLVEVRALRRSRHESRYDLVYSAVLNHQAAIRGAKNDDDQERADEALWNEVLY